MSNNSQFHNTYRDTYIGVKAAREEYEKRLKFLERYKGSAGYDEDIKQAQEEFEGKLEGIRSAARGGFNLAFEGMKAKTAPADTLDVPTEEMLRVLQALDMRDTFTAQELMQAARNCEGSETALRTLEGMAVKKGVVPEGTMKLKSTADQARGVFEQLQHAANDLMQWDGRNHSEIMGERMQSHHARKWGGEGKEEKDLPPIGTAWVEERQPGLTATHTLETIIGHGEDGKLNCSPEALKFLD